MSPGAVGCCIVEGPAAFQPVGNLDEWFDDRRDYGDDFARLLHAAVDRRTRLNLQGQGEDPVLLALGSLWSHTDDEVRKLLAAAVVLASGLSLTERDVGRGVGKLAVLLGVPLATSREPGRNRADSPSPITFPEQ